MTSILPTEPIIRMPMVIHPKPESGVLTSALPLEHTAVHARLTGMLARVTVTQRFQNTLEQPAELEYLFPLPEDASISSFALQIGERRLTGEVEEREAARAGFESALQAGKRAGLLEQRRPNLVAVRLANVLPGEQFQAVVEYQQRLKLEEDGIEFLFPMGLTPKYDSRAHGAEGEGVHAPIAAAGEQIGTVEITVLADHALFEGRPTSPSHALKVISGTEGLEVRLEGVVIPDHDFVLRLPTRAEALAAAAWAAGQPDKEFFLAAFLPERLDDQNGYAAPQREFIFVLDRSGSMHGAPIQQARNALRACLRALNPNDTFRILLFDDQLEWFHREALTINQAAIDEADRFLDAVEGRGGTEITAALEAALRQPAGTERLRTVVFLTDGAVSAEQRTLDLLQKQIGAARVFTFGIGPSVNRALLNRMAVQGRGQSFFLQLDEDIEGAIIRFQDRVSFPLLTDLTLEWVNAKTWDLYPKHLPDLYAGNALEITGRLARKNGPVAAILRGKRAGQAVEVRLEIPEAQADDPAVARVWAKARVDDLLDELLLDPRRQEALRSEVIGLALEYDLVTPYTSFVAVDPQAAASGKPAKILVSQPLPQGLDLQGFAPPAGGPGLLHASMPVPTFLRSARQSRQAFSAHAVHRQMQDSTGAPAPMMAAQAPSAPELPAAEGQLRLLARTQRFDGSWNGSVEHTAAALLAFVRAGHTTRSGIYRQALRRAAAWLATNRGQGLEQFLRARALAVIEARLPADAPLELAKFGLPDPVNDLERAALGENVAPPAAIHTIDDLRLAGLLNAALAVPEKLLQGDDGALAAIWSAALPAVTGKQ